MHFFQPQTHNLTSGGSASGYSAPSEIPFEYYFVAILYKIFGYHDFIFRMVNTLIFLLGIYYLFKTCQLLFKDFFWASAVSLFFFTSPVLVYYGNNFLTDSSALAFSLIAWFYFIRFYQDNEQKDLSIASGFFLLGGASKISALISLVAILAIFLFDFLNIINFHKDRKVFTRPLYSILVLLTPFLIIASWVLYARWYNSIHGSVYFSTRIIPLWSLDHEQIKMVLDNIKGLWLPQYFHKFSLYFLAFTFLFSIGFIKKANPLLMTANILILVGSIIYTVLWFATFKDHDYYTINLYILLVLTLLNFFRILKNTFPLVFSSWILKFIFMIFLIFNMNHARSEMNGRYNGWWTEYKEYKDYHVITPYLRSIGIEAKDTVICLPDMTHFTLYLMNQYGWTGCLGYNADSSGIAASIDRGAKYLIINGEETLRRDYLKSFERKQIGEFDSVKIFRLKE
ncbi:MAG: glycosyltransferase family 39 protein [Bacteroidales bacterium]|nr:glycosyltransferase family 39 protein [Bacteroidales bacterium]MCB8998917.1 glycosyltransferase family 39 protein [Bacteroidales bacterium]